MNAGDVKVGFIAGLIAVSATTLVNITGRVLGILPEPTDLKYMSEWIVDAADSPVAAFIVGVLIHLLAGSLIGVLYTLLFERRTPGTGMLFMVGGWLVMMVVLFPLTGRGFFGLDVGPVMTVVTFVLSMFYGAVAGFVAGRLTARGAGSANR